MGHPQSPAWAPVVPAIQAGVVAVYALLLQVPYQWGLELAMVLTAPFAFGTAWTLGLLVRRRRGANRPDGGEYMIATFGNVVMALGFVLSVLLWLAILWFTYGLRDF